MPGGTRAEKRPPFRGCTDLRSSNLNLKTAIGSLSQNSFRLRSWGQITLAQSYPDVADGGTR